MKAKRIFLAAMLTVAVGSMFVFAGCGDDEGKVDENHQHDYVWEIDKEATCTEVGHRTGKCECGDTKSEEIPLAPHKLEGEITPTQDSTCTAEGTGTQMCSVCHTAQPVTIPKKDHTLTHHESVPAACNADGTLEYWHCSTCNNDYLDEKGQNLAGSVTIPKESVEHTWNEKHVCSVCGAADPNSPHTCVPTLVAEIPSTCKVQGTMKHYKCYECGKIYEDEECTKELSEADLILELSDDHGGKQNAVFYEEIPAKDCMTYGKKRRYDCKVCGRHFMTEDLDPDKEYRDIEEAGDFGEDVLQTPKSNRHTKWHVLQQADATCTKIGWKTTLIECETCGNLYLPDDINQSGESSGIVKPQVDEEKNEIPDTVRDPVDRAEYELDIDPNNHDSLVHRFKTPSTSCGRDSVGYKMECYECTACGNFYQDKECKISVTKDEALDFAVHGTMTYVEATESTCTAHGHPAHWDCGSCGEHFNTGKPAAETDPIPEAEYELPFIEHDFSEYKSNSKGHWLICKVCGTPEVDEDGIIKMEEHDMDEGEDDNCYVCGFGGVDYASLFDIEVKQDDEGNDYAVIKGLAKAPEETVYELAKREDEGETVLRIPETDKEGNPVKEIQAGALSTNIKTEYGNVFNRITEVIIPNTVTKIGEGAFYGYMDRMPAFQRIEFEEGAEVVEIESGSYGAFQNLTNLKTLILPKNMTTIPYQMVFNCSALVEIHMPERVTYDGNLEMTQVFYNCSSLEVLDLWCLDGKSFSFGWNCLYGCGALKDIYIPESITKLGTTSFYGCTAIEHIYYGGDENDWTSLCNTSKANETYPWNHNNARLTEDSIRENNIVVYSFTHTGNEY